MNDLNERPIVLMRFLAALFFYLACDSAFLAVRKYISFQENQLFISEIGCLTTSIKFVIFTLLFYCFFKPHKIGEYVIGRKPFHFTNLSVTSLLLFVILSPILLRLDDAIGFIHYDITLEVMYYGYLPVSAVLWLISLVLVIRTLNYEEGIGYRPKFWIRTLIGTPVLAFLFQLKWSYY